MTKKRRRRDHRLEAEGGELMLAAMVDMMVNLLIFLLTLYGTGPEGLASEVDVPGATQRGDQPARVSVAVGSEAVRVDGETVLRLTGAAGDARLPADAVTDGRVDALALALEPLLQAAKPATGPDGKPEPTELVLQVDKRLSWDVVGPIVATASESGFDRVRFLVRADGRAE